MYSLSTVISAMEKNEAGEGDGECGSDEGEGGCN